MHRGEPGTANGSTTADFGAWLRTLREAAGLTQEELASRANLTAKAISALERGERKRPYPHTVRSLADALELSEDERTSLLATVPRRGGAAPPDGALTALPNLDLPAPPTPLLGREREMDELRAFLREARLLTLTGTGGVGKTRLALEAARRAARDFADGAAFVPLAPVSSPELVFQTVARSLAIREAEERTPYELLCSYLRGKHMLLVLDNFEHVLGSAPEVAALIEACPRLTVLVTSRAPLRIRGEQEYPVGPLALPASTLSPEPREVEGSASGSLFVERARAASPAFEVTEENAGAVAAICWRLDGLPLALELAAAKARFLDPGALLSRLDRALSASWARDLPERQRTMRATLDWSHDLLEGPEQELFRRLSVFAGGFTLEAAEAVGAAREVEAEEILELLGRLVEQSLVKVRPDADGVRYGVLEPVRQYALEKLEESGEAEETRGRHIRYYLALAERAEPRIKGEEQIEWLDRLETENDNLRAAIGWSLDKGDPWTVTRFGWALGMYWVMRTRHREGRAWMERALESGDLAAGRRTKALWALAVCVYGSGDDERLLAISEEGVALAREVGDAQGEAYALGMMGFATLQLGELEEATRILQRGVELFREQDDEWGTAHLLTHLAVVPMRRGDHARAAEYAEEALALTRRTGDRLAGDIALSLLARAAWASDEPGRAAQYFREALQLSYEARNTTNMLDYLRGLAAVAAVSNEPRRAARLLGVTETLQETREAPLYASSERDFGQSAIFAARERLGNPAWTEAREEGRTMTLDEAVAYALESSPEEAAETDQRATPSL